MSAPNTPKSGQHLEGAHLTGTPGKEPDDRRGFVTKVGASVAMACGIAVSYGKLAAISLNYLTPTKKPVRWQFVATLGQLQVGDSVDYVAPSGAKIVITRQDSGGGIESFVALSSVCPHLGCSVHWESAKNRFFCPCHNGAFDPAGKAILGPPKSANQELKKFPLLVRSGMLFIDPPMTAVARGEA